MDDLTTDTLHQLVHVTNSRPRFHHEGQVLQSRAMPRVRPRLDRRIKEQVGARFSLRWSKRELVLCCYEQLESDQGHHFVVIAFGAREIRNVDTKMAQHPLNLSRQPLRAS